MVTPNLEHSGLPESATGSGGDCGLRSPEERKSTGCPRLLSVMDKAQDDFSAFRNDNIVRDGLAACVDRRIESRSGPAAIFESDRVNRAEIAAFRAAWREQRRDFLLRVRPIAQDNVPPAPIAALPSNENQHLMEAVFNVAAERQYLTRLLARDWINGEKVRGKDLSRIDPEHTRVENWTTVLAELFNILYYTATRLAWELGSRHRDYDLLFEPNFRPQAWHWRCIVIPEVAHQFERLAQIDHHHTVDDLLHWLRFIYLREVSLGYEDLEGEELGEHEINFAALPADVQSHVRSLKAIRLLLLMAGIEPNPGPPKRPGGRGGKSPNRGANHGSARKEHVSVQRPHKKLTIIRPGQRVPPAAVPDAKALVLASPPVVEDRFLLDRNGNVDIPADIPDRLAYAWCRQLLEAVNRSLQGNRAMARLMSGYRRFLSIHPDANNRPLGQIVQFTDRSRALLTGVDPTGVPPYIPPPIGPGGGPAYYLPEADDDEEPPPLEDEDGHVADDVAPPAQRVEPQARNPPPPPAPAQPPAAGAARHHDPPVRDHAGLVARALHEEELQRRGEADAQREIERDRRQEVGVRAQQIIEDPQHMMQVLQEVHDEVQAGIDQGFQVNNRVVRAFAFHGRFLKGSQSTFRDGTGSTEVPRSVCDPIVSVNVYADGTWSTDADGHIVSFNVTQNMLNVACRSVACATKEARFRNIFAGLQQSAEIKQEIAALGITQKVDYMFTVELVAFVLTGCVSAAGSIRWLNECEEWVLDKYTILQLPPGWRERVVGVIFHADTMKFQASTATNCRAAPFTIEGVVPAVPDPSDFKTLIAAMLKRMFPDLPERSEETLRQLDQLSVDLAEYIDAHFNRDNDLVVDDELLERMCKGRPAYEAQAIRDGWTRARDDPVGTTDWYLTLPYKCFIKLEAYPEGSFKPPRFIQSLDPAARGVQCYFMAGILHKIEVGTRACNVKGLNPDQITERLREKFANMDLVCESDFGAFECSIGPDLKAVCENRIFLMLADNDAQRQFITRALGRQTVNVIGPCFTIPHYHHVRMSGDLWTSIGNLVTNIVITAFVHELDIPTTVFRSIFEGDDGVTWAPRDLKRCETRSKLCGVKLDLVIAPWEALSFCGNHFEQIWDGSVIRCRDPIRAAVNSTILFNAPRGTRRWDVMLQRSKVICYLQYPVVPDAFVFFCVVERFTRKEQVDEDLLLRWGLLKEYAGHGVERCVPDWLVKGPDGTELTDAQFAQLIFDRNLAAGGHCPLARIHEMIAICRKAGGDFNHIVLPSPFDRDGTASWFQRDGTRYTHLSHTFIPRRCVSNRQDPVNPTRSGLFGRLTSGVSCRHYRRGAGPGLKFPIEHDKYGSQPTSDFGWSALLPLFFVALLILLFWSLVAAGSVQYVRQARYVRDNSFTSFNPVTCLPHSCDPLPQCVFRFERYEPLVPWEPPPPPLETFWQRASYREGHNPLTTNSLPEMLSSYSWHYASMFVQFIVEACDFVGVSARAVFQWALSPLSMYDVTVFREGLLRQYTWINPWTTWEPSSWVAVAHACLVHAINGFLPLYIAMWVRFIVRRIPFIPRMDRIRGVCTIAWYCGVYACCLNHVMFFIYPILLFSVTTLLLVTFITLLRVYFTVGLHLFQVVGTILAVGFNMVHFLMPVLRFAWWVFTMPIEW